MRLDASQVLQCGKYAPMEIAAIAAENESGRFIDRVNHSGGTAVVSLGIWTSGVDSLGERAGALSSATITTTTIPRKINRKVLLRLRIDVLFLLLV